MYSYFKGCVTEVTGSHITLEVANIGYLIKVPNPFSFKLGENLTIYIHHHVREDAVELYGFKSACEKEMFERLLTVKGMGPKGSMAILASTTPDEIASAIERGDAKFFVSFPGIGAKSSQQIVLDLKGKVNFVSEAPEVNKCSEDVSLALKSLGYSSQEIKQAIKAIDIDQNTSTSDAVRKALKYLRK